MSGLQSKDFLNTLFHFCVTGLASSPTNWTKSQRNCKTPNYMENHATDMCELHKDTTTETGMWTNVFRVEISAHVDHGNTFYDNKQIYLFSLMGIINAEGHF